jgi:hypothetical protein
VRAASTADSLAAQRCIDREDYTNSRRNRTVFGFRTRGDIAGSWHGKLYGDGDSLYGRDPNAIASWFRTNLGTIVL